jgi:hypothetical protein
MRVKAGGGGNKEDDSEESPSDSNGKDSSHQKKTSGGGGAEAVGRVNNLVGTDVDVITSSLVSRASRTAH